MDFGLCANLTDAALIALAKQSPRLLKISLMGCEKVQLLALHWVRAKMVADRL